MNPTILAIIEKTLGHEGAYSNRPSDPGGETMWGITKRVAVANGYTGPMKSLPRETAIRIYYKVYAETPGFVAVAEISLAVGAELFDTGVNVGPARPALWFQEWLNLFNQRGKLYPDIKEDGKIGAGTLAAFRAYRAKRGADADKVMVAALNGDQSTHYKSISRSREANEDFAYGWVRARVAA